MATDRLDSRFFVSFPSGERDWLDWTGSFCLYPMRAAFGYKVAERSGKNSVDIKKISYSVLAIFLFFLTLPLLLLPLVFGVIALAVSPSHRRNYRQLKEYFQEDAKQFSNHHEAYSFYDAARRGAEVVREGTAIVLPGGTRKKFRTGYKQEIKITYTVETGLCLEDLQQIQKIEKQGFGRRNVTHVDKLQAQGRGFILARIEDSGKIVGVLHYRPYGSVAPDNLYIATVCRLAKYGGKGIAEELMRLFKEKAPKQYKKASLHVRESSPVQQLYANKGFLRVEAGDVASTYFDPPERALYMECAFRA